MHRKQQTGRAILMALLALFVTAILTVFGLLTHGAIFTWAMWPFYVGAIVVAILLAMHVRQHIRQRQKDD